MTNTKRALDATKDAIRASLANGGLFRVGNSFFFAVNVPDNSVGCSGSRCSNCLEKTAYCEHLCSNCGFPFIGPFGVPQIAIWEQLSPRQKMTVVENVWDGWTKGRLIIANHRFFPLTPGELHEITRSDIQTLALFEYLYGMLPQEIERSPITVHL